MVFKRIINSILPSKPTFCGRRKWQGEKTCVWRDYSVGSHIKPKPAALRFIVCKKWAAIWRSLERAKQRAWKTRIPHFFRARKERSGKARRLTRKRFKPNTSHWGREEGCKMKIVIIGGVSWRHAGELFSKRILIQGYRHVYFDRGKYTETVPLTQK